MCMYIRGPAGPGPGSINEVVNRGGWSGRREWVCGWGGRGGGVCCPSHSTVYLLELRVACCECYALRLAKAKEKEKECGVPRCGVGVIVIGFGVRCTK